MDRYERRYGRDIAFVMLLLWSFVIVVTSARSTVLGVLAVLSLPAGSVAALAIAQRRSAAERAAFQQTFSEDPSTTQRGDLPK